MLLVLYLIIYSLLSLSLFYRVNGSYFIKMASIAMAFFISTITYFSLDSFKGWPTGDRVVQEVMLVAVSVTEPTDVDGEGGIYIWVLGEKSDPKIMLGVLTYESSPGEPKAHKLPYTEKNAEFAYRAQKALEEGMIVMLNSKESSGSGDDTGVEGDGTIKGGTFYQDEIASDWNIINEFELPAK